MKTADIHTRIITRESSRPGPGDNHSDGPVRNIQQKFWSDYIQQGKPLEDYHRKLNIPGYELLCILGRGGMGTVFLARQPQLNRLVAIKMLNRDHAHDPIFIDMIRREGKTMGVLSHPNIVSCHDIITNESGIFLIMEFIPGHLTARDLVTRFGPLPERIVIGILLEVIRGLSYIQTKGITHKDLKPDNIMFFWENAVPPQSLQELFDAPENRITICDFGIADQRAYHAKAANSNKVLGSPAYMAPEQIFEEENITQASEIYSLGATAYFLLTGKQPFQDMTPEQCFEKKCSEPLRLPTGNARKLHSRFIQVLNRMGEAHPLDRYQTYQELQKDLMALEQKYGGLHRRRKNYAERYKGFILGIVISVCFAVFIGCSFYSYHIWEISRKSHKLPRNLSFFFWNGNVDSWKIIQDHQDFSKSILIGFAQNQEIQLKEQLQNNEILDFSFRLLGKGDCRMNILDHEQKVRGVIRLIRTEEKIFRLQFSLDGRDISIEAPPDFSQLTWTHGRIAMGSRRVKLYVNRELIALGHFKTPVQNWNLQLCPGTAQMLQIQSMFISTEEQNKSFLNFLLSGAGNEE